MEFSPLLRCKRTREHVAHVPQGASERFCEHPYGYTTTTAYHHRLARTTPAAMDPSLSPSLPLSQTGAAVTLAGPFPELPVIGWSL